MALKTLILCNSPREGGHYAKRAGLPRWTYRVVTNPGQVKGLPFKGTEVHVLPSFAERANRAALLATLRYKRAEFFYVDPADLPTLEELDAERQAGELGELDDDVLEAAYAAQAEFPHAEWGAARRRDKVAAMTDDEVARLLAGSAPAEAVEVVKAVKAAPKPRKPRMPPTVSAEDFFGSA